MEKKKSLLQSILLRVHYKTSLAMVAILLGLLAFSGFYFFGQNIVNEAEEQQRIARIQMNESSEAYESDMMQESVEPEQSSEETEQTIEKNIGGQAGETITPTLLPTVTVTPTTPVNIATPSATATPSASLSAVHFVLGDPNAQIAILAYYDFECLKCASFIADTLPQLKAEYIDTGKVKMIFKNYPLSTHKTAPIAHNAAMCAADQGKFWPFHDALFVKQSEWSGKNEEEARALMKSYSAALGLNKDVFASCIENNKFISYIEKDKEDGKGRGIPGAPTFIIGDDILGAHPYEEFKAVLDAQ